MYQTLLTNLENNIFTITINRPDKLNAINRVVMDELDQAVDEIYHRADISSALITGAGAKAFVAGADISEFGETEKEGQLLSLKGQAIFKKIEQCPKPVVAAVNGFALGAGNELAMSCHVRIAASNAFFGQPEVNLGLVPGYGGTQRLAQLIGKGRALELLLSAERIDAPTALQYGLVTQVVPPEELIAKSRGFLEHLNTKGPLALAGCIRAANAVFDETENGFQIEAEIFGSCFGTADMKEGKAAFLEKRKAVFTGK